MSTYATEEEQIEAMKKWWKTNGKSIIFGIALGIGGLAVWKSWQANITTQSHKASSKFEQLLANMKEKKTGHIKGVGEHVIATYEATAYAPLSALLLAKQALEEDDDLDSAETQLRWAMEHAKLPEIEFVARQRLARVLLVKDQADAALSLLEQDERPPKQASFHELKGDILRAKGDITKARLAYLQALALRAGPGDADTLQMKLDALSSSDEEQGKRETSQGSEELDQMQKKNSAQDLDENKKKEAQSQPEEEKIKDDVEKENEDEENDKESENVAAEAVQGEDEGEAESEKTP